VAECPTVVMSKGKVDHPMVVYYWYAQSEGMMALLAKYRPSSFREGSIHEQLVSVLRPYSPNEDGRLTKLPTDFP